MNMNERAISVVPSCRRRRGLGGRTRFCAMTYICDKPPAQQPVGGRRRPAFSSGPVFRLS